MGFPGFRMVRLIVSGFCMGAMDAIESLYQGTAYCPPKNETRRGMLILVSWRMINGRADKNEAFAPAALRILSEKYPCPTGRH
jgi:hypothetical protein